MRLRTWLIAAAITLPMGYCTADLFVLDRGLKVDAAASPDGKAYRLRPGSWVTSVTGSEATTIGRTIHLRFRTRPSSYLYAHEFRHVTEGVFIPRYLVDPGYKARKESDAHAWGCAHRNDPHFLYIERVMRRVSLQGLTPQGPAGLLGLPITCEVSS